jgi:hypothetical protein
MKNLIGFNDENLPRVDGQCAFGCSIDVQTSTQASLRCDMVFDEI